MNFVNSIGPFLLILVAAAVWRWAGDGAATSETDYLVSAAEIRGWQTDEADRFVLVDVREEPESSVSMLPGAITLADFERSAKHRGKIVVAYCTVGVRSGAYVAKLRQQGWEAYNYRGGILDWCKENLPLITPDGQPTSRVHTYSSRYSVPASYQAVRR